MLRREIVEIEMSEDKDRHLQETLWQTTDHVSDQANESKHKQRPRRKVGEKKKNNSINVTPETMWQATDQPQNQTDTSKRRQKPQRKAGEKKKSNGANLSLEEKLWLAADKLRSHMDAAEYKHIVLGLIFLKYISDAFQEQYEALKKDPYADPEDPDEYLAKNIFWVPKEARWPALQAQAKLSNIGKLVDDAMIAIEKANTTLKGVLPKDYARPVLDQQRLGELIDLIGTIGLGDKENQSKDILGRVYEYFLSKFASAEGKGGGEFYTPQCVVKLLVEMLEPYKGRIYDPCCGSGGMFVQSEKFVKAHGGRIGDLSIYGQESNATTWRLAKMNMAIRRIEANLGPYHADTFHNDLHQGLAADFILANPPFNISDWGGDRLQDDARWRKYGTPPEGNANFAWVQQIIFRLAPAGVAGFVLANGSMSSNSGGEGEIRKAIVEADQVDCIVALPSQLFYSTQIPACLWFIARKKNDGKFRDRSGQILFINARKLGHLIDRTHKELSDEEIERIAHTYHAWRGERGEDEYKDIPGFCKSAIKEDTRQHSYILSPGRYVGAEEIEDDSESFDDKMMQLTKELEMLFEESTQLQGMIRDNLQRFGYGK